MFTYWLPDENSQKQEHTTNSNSIVIIGANGSGKSKLGAWIEQQSFNAVHRVGAQRNLTFNANIALKSYSQAEDIVFFGTDDKRVQQSKIARWSNGSYTTKMIEDFEAVLAALISLKNNELEIFHADAKEAEKNERPHPHAPETSIDKLIRIWSEVLPQRKIGLEDSKFFAILEKDGVKEKYPATEMSDGERSVLYLIAQVLCVPTNKILIIDEPELHLHRSLMNRLWMALERARQDCLFIYITHDTRFAAMHSHAEKIWVRDYDGRCWNIQKLTSDELPDELLLEILGNRQPIIFVEGERGSFDVQLYSALYPDHYVIPCGSCTQVIARTKAFFANPGLHHHSVYGIIDRDYRSDYELDKYKKQHIYSINVAEVENLFLVEELIKTIAEHLGKDPDEVFSNIKAYIIEQRFKNQMNGQICQSVVAQIKYCLASAEIAKATDADVIDSLNTLWESLSFDQIKQEQTVRFQNALSDGYAGVIKIFNEKGLSSSIGHYLGLQNQEYCSLVIALLKTDKRVDIIDALTPYLPTEITR